MLQRVKGLYLLLFFCWVFSNATMLVAQSTTIYRPSAYSGGRYINPAYAYDGISSTYSYANESNNLGANEYWYGFSAVLGTPSSVKLKITSSVGGSTGATALLAYSTDGGVNWTYIYSGVHTRSQQTDDVVLSNSQDLTKVRVEAQVYAPITTGIQQNIYEIWIEVTE
jgi:hypothetical protein